MRRGHVHLGFVAIVLAAATALPARAQKTEAGLIAAWEQEQKADARTTKLEKTGERHYRFATRRFPFDGELIIRNVVIEDARIQNEETWTSGTVEVELQNVAEDFYRTFARSYAQWMMTNTLFWNDSAQKWLSAEGYYAQFRARLPNGVKLWPVLFGYGWWAILLAILIFLLYSVSRVTRRAKEMVKRNDRVLEISERNSQIAQRNLQLQEEKARLLREILEELKRSKPS